MKFIKMIRFDLQNGMLRFKLLYLCPVLIAVVSVVDLSNRFYWMRVNNEVQSQVIALGDYWYYLYGGMQEYIPSPTSAFEFPMMWLMVFLTIPLLVLNYPFRDMHTFGQQVLVHTGGRSSWWLSKCLWNTLCTLVYHLLLVLVLVIACLLSGAEISNAIHVDLIKRAFELKDDIELVQRDAIPLLIFIVPVLISVGINLFQMVLSLLVKPVFSFMITSVLMLASAYLMVPYMLGNYAMPLRYRWILPESAISVNTGLLVSIGFIILTIVGGLIRFRYYDILNRE